MGQQGKNGYVGFYNGQRCEVYADSKYEGWQKAVEHFGVKGKKVYDVHVGLAEVNGEQVVHVAVD